MTTKTLTPPVDFMFRAFSDRTRLRILHLLRGGELCVCDLVEVLGVPQPKASRHLAYLRKAGLVLDMHGSQYSLMLGAEQLAFAGLKMPEIEEADSPRTLFEERITQIRDFCKSFDELYGAFLKARVGGWDGVRQSIRKWMGETPVRKSAAA